MSIKDCNNLSVTAASDKCSCGPLMRLRGKDRFGIPRYSRVKKPKICAWHKKNPWCECRGRILCSQHTIELCWWSAKKMVETKQIPSWIKEWVKKNPDE